MSDTIRKGVAPAYLILCLVLGGSAQGIWANAILQLMAIGIIAWAALDRQSTVVPRAARQLGLIAALGLLLVALQLVPLPPSLWTALPGRATIADGFMLLGVSPGWLPLSLSPYDSIATIAAFLPPLAMLIAVVKLGCRSSWLALAIVAATAAAVLLGALQVASEASPQSPWYFYRHTNFGVATGFFANSNHMATLLLVAIPFVAALGTGAGKWTDDPRKRSAVIAVISGSLVMILVGIGLNGSLAAYGLTLPVSIASLLLIVRPRSRWVSSSALGLGLLSLVSFVLLIASPINERFVPAGAATSVSTRQEMLEHGVKAATTYAPVGAGLGTFGTVYRLFEDPSAVGRVYVDHAHNDYLELAVELGVPGIALILLFLGWWGRAAWQVGRSQAFDHYAAAGAISSATILVHSAVDYPLRTAAVGALFATSLALMIVSRRSADGKTDLRPTRHLVID